MGDLSNLPLPAPFFAILVGAAVVLFVLLQLSVLHHAYHRIGLGLHVAFLVLIALPVGSYFNVPIAEWPDRQVLAGILAVLLASLPTALLHRRSAAPR